MVRSPARLAASILICIITGILGSIVIITGPGSWYQLLEKPPFSPPSWVFGPVWTILYVLMGTSLYLVWAEGFNRRDVRVATTAFVVQLALNGIWSPLFFGLHSTLLGLVDIIFLWIALAVTVRLVQTVRREAAYLLLPYICWVSFAAILNGAIWVMNP